LSLDNEAVLLKREILIRVARHAWAGTLTTGLRKLPFEMTASGRPSYRCCVHHERAILKDRTLAVLGLNLETRDEAMDLNEAAATAWARTEPDPFPLTVVDEACKGCVHTRYSVTNACMGCVARPCRNVCPKGSVTVAGGRASIDPETCISCGKCHEACPYHAIVHIPVPCEEACPVGAVSKDADGKEQIDESRCILCGKCVMACPFGAVMEKSDIVRVIRRLKDQKPTVAILAPSVLAQFPGTLAQIYGAVKSLGFTAVAEVAEGAESTAQHEAEEWDHLVASGKQPFLVTSCCPSWTRAARQIPGMMPFVSSTPTPMAYAARKAKVDYPGAEVVFIGPCTAKRVEALETSTADAVLTFEELGALFVAQGVEVNRAAPLDLAAQRPEGRGFALSGGVAGAVAHYLGAEKAAGVKTELINGLNKKSLNLLRVYAKGKGPANLVEVMACEGGCVAGPGKVCSVKVALDQWAKEPKAVVQ
jgi:[FeFe] hydrogenase (group B1/B3)